MNKLYNSKECRDFIKLCQVHEFKNRKVLRDENNYVVGFNIFLPTVSGVQEKALSNVARYTNSKKIIEPCFLTKDKMGIKVSLTRK